MNVDMLPKIQIELIVKEKDVEALITIITESARTGKIGDGKIFVTDAAEAMRIRTGERGIEAVFGVREPLAVVNS